MMIDFEVKAQEILEKLPNGVFMLSNSGNIIYSNSGFEKITGFSTRETVKQPFALLFANNADKEKAEHDIETAVRKGAVISEGWKVRKDGSRFWGIITIIALTGKKTVDFLCTLADGTEAKEQEWSLKQSEENYRLMVDAVRDYAIFMLDPTGHIMTWNEGAKRTKGYNSYEIIGKHFSTFYTSEDLEDKKPERELRIAIETGKYEEEGWRVRKNGSVFWANVIITALYNEQNRLVGFGKVTRDLTERKENEEILRQSEERYRSLVEQVTDYGIFMLDEKGRIISWNEGANRIAGYTEKEVLGKYFSIFYPEEDVLNRKPAYELKKAIAEGKYEEEGWRIRKDGNLFWASVVITAIYNSRGTLIGFSKVTRDLTERKNAEKALRESYQQYRKLAEELKIANAELQYANQELEQFTSIVSHDLQEPLRAIKSFLQLIELRLSGQQDDDLKLYIKKSIGSANRMRVLIQNLLSYSQLNKIEVVSEKVVVSELIAHALQNVKPVIDATQAVVEVENEVEEVEGDPVQLLQLVQNLLSNALKFAGADAPQIKIKSYLEKGQVKFSISDNGIGIARDDMEKIFEIFKRLHTAASYPGTGIGLAICKKIVERHNGRIWPESEPGAGTTFYFTLNDHNTAKIS